ncbi:MAG: MobA/MobL family protein [Rhizobiales bacterium]|nr:MobA/MobL family protein [Hyphomicrobiales bacterium]
MAIFNLTVKTISRADNRSATAAAAYRSGSRIVDERSGAVHDYRRRSGVADTFIVAPPLADWATDRMALWNAAEASENRRNSTVAREYEIALPAELDAGGRRALTERFARYLVDRYGVAADVALHSPPGEGDWRNQHAHVLTTTRVVDADGMAEKTRILDSAKTGSVEVSEIRAMWAELANQALRAIGSEARIDARSRADRGLDGDPALHLGPGLTAVERRRRREARTAGVPYTPGSGPAQHNADLMAERRADAQIAAIDRRLAAADQAEHLAAERAAEAQRRRDAEERAQKARQEAEAAQKARQAAEKAARPPELPQQASPRPSPPLPPPAAPSRAAQPPRPATEAPKPVTAGSAGRPPADPSRPWTPAQIPADQRPIAGAVLRLELEPRRSPGQQRVLEAAWRALGDLAKPFKAWIEMLRSSLRQAELAKDAIAARDRVAGWAPQFADLVDRLRTGGFLPPAAGPGGPAAPGRPPRGRGGPER